MEEKVQKKEKMSYEELEQVASQLSAQVQQLYGNLQRAQLSNMFQRVDFLFRVLENADRFNSDFVKKCTDELEQVLTLPPKEEEEKE